MAQVRKVESVETRKRIRPVLAVAAGSAILFGWLAHAVAAGDTMGFDLQVRGAIHAWASVPLTWAMHAVTQLGSFGFVVAVVALVVWRLVAARHRHAAVLFVTTVLGGEILDQLLKLIFHRPRPAPFFGFPALASYSFPSGHSVASCCLYAALAVLLSARWRRPAARAGVWTAAVLAVVLVGVSRVYLGVHYPSDVVGGYLAAGCWLASVRAAWRSRITGRSTG